MIVYNIYIPGEVPGLHPGAHGDGAGGRLAADPQRGLGAIA